MRVIPVGGEHATEHARRDAEVVAPDELAGDVGEALQDGRLVPLAADVTCSRKEQEEEEETEGSQLGSMCIRVLCVCLVL